MENKVYIVIVTYNGMKWIHQCLSSCKNFTIIVVDNASTDNTVSFIKQHFPDVVLLPQTKNLGFGQANNIGISYALGHNASYVFLLNQDAYLRKNTIENLITVYKENQEYGILSPIHLNGKGDKLDRNFSNYIAYDKNSHLYFDAVNKSLNEVYDVPFVNAAAWLLPRKTLELIGGFDPILFHYGEDDNYCQRIRYFSLKIGVVPNSFVLHDREDRLKVELKFKEKLKLRERELKVRWANVNNENDNIVKKYKYKLKKKIFRSILKFRFDTTRFLIHEYKLVNKITPEIQKSREINSKPGAHYV